jgi:hypothetical protein
MLFIIFLSTQRCFQQVELLLSGTACLDTRANTDLMNIIYSDLHNRM